MNTNDLPFNTHRYHLNNLILCHMLQELHTVMTMLLLRQGSKRYFGKGITIYLLNKGLLPS